MEQTCALRFSRENKQKAAILMAFAKFVFVWVEISFIFKGFRLPIDSGSIFPKMCQKKWGLFSMLYEEPAKKFILIIEQIPPMGKPLIIFELMKIMLI